MFVGHVSASPDSTVPLTARTLYNEGVQHLQKGKLRDAEGALQSALSSHDERTQPPALYNLGHVRFQQGIQLLKDSASAPQAQANGSFTSDQATLAINAADSALASRQVDAIVRAYRQGKGAAKDLKKAAAAVKKAMENHGAVLSKWQRSSGDFKSAFELDPSLKDADFNASVVDRQIAALVDQKQQLETMMGQMSDKRKELQEKLNQLKSKIPDGMQEQKDGDGDEEEEENNPPKAPNGEEEEKKQSKEDEGKEVSLTWEEAMRLLNALKLDGNRKLPMGDQGNTPPKNRKGKDW